jgi:hypothetical protein
VTEPLALQVQELHQGTDRVLVLGDLLSRRSSHGWFTPSEVLGAFEALRVPAPGNVNQALSQLRARGMVLRRNTGGGWSVTPRGRQQVVKLMGEIDPASLAIEKTDTPTAEFGHARHTLIPPFFAPAGWLPGIQRFLGQFPFDTNVFCMTRFPASEVDPVLPAIEASREALRGHGLQLHLASDRQIDDDLWGNVAAHGWACRYGIGMFEDRAGRGLNQNLVAEVGAMLMTGRRCALLKDKSQPGLPTDFVGQIYKSVDFDDRESVSVEVHSWAREDLGLGRCENCS